MNINDLKTAGEFAKQYGVKMLVYGAPGAGKTPVANTAPSPVMLVVEPGMLSMRGSQIPAFEAYEPSKVEEFFKWFLESNEANRFDTLIVDSVSQLSEIILDEEQGRCKDGRMAYGKMASRVLDIASRLYFLPQKHIYLVAKQAVVDEGGGSRRKPYFPGQELNVKVPHLFDEILHLGRYNIPGVVGEQKAFLCTERFDTIARDRSGRLSEFEPPHVGNIITKAMQ